MTVKIIHRYNFICKNNNNHNFQQYCKNTILHLYCSTSKHHASTNMNRKAHIINIPRHIVHMDMDTFFVSVERLRNSDLNNRPIIIGGLSDRGVVAGCSYEARKFGVHSAMPMKQARQLCPQAVFIRGERELYSKYSSLVTNIIASNVPLYEKASIDEHYIDLTGMDRFFGAFKFSQELRQTIIKETGLPISFGLSVNKTVAKIATGEAKHCTSRELYVEQKDVQSFLNPLSIKKIPMLGPKTYQKLSSLGIETIETLSKTSPDLLKIELGKNGISLWQKANGIDNSPVEQVCEKKSISSEETFEVDTSDTKLLNEWIVRITEKLAFELRNSNRLASCIAIKIKYADFTTQTMQKQIPHTAFDHLLFDEAKGLFAKLYQPRKMVRLIGIRLSNLISGNQQLNLFEDTTEQTNLYQALDNIRKKFGDNAVGRASGR